ncbi:hypothetical protein Tco_0860722 [Tanacetum coccineum]|uniref:Amino acid transporter transmembrane domain-containing protein n=1 Tax=Tanacetum coccineum TaxID=301880 RepID=A0ABQ5BFT4_9ASTR
MAATQRQSAATLTEQGILDGSPSTDADSQRRFHSIGAKRIGGHGHDKRAYLHSKHMYNLDRMKSQKLTMCLGVFTAFNIGVGVPIFVVVCQ